MKAFVVLACMVIAAVIFTGGCENRHTDTGTPQPPELLVFCGITMIDPVMVLSEMAEKRLSVRIQLTYGGSKDLAKSIIVNRLGDIYLPGTQAFIDEMDADGHIALSRQVGHNQIAFFVRKGNPKNIDGRLVNLMNPALLVAIGHQDLGSVGAEAKRILEQKGIYDQVIRNTAFMASDSKGMTMGLREKRIDLAMNWRSVIRFKDNADYMDEIDIEPGYAVKHPLVMGRLVYSRHPDIADQFIALCASETGRKIFGKYGF